MNDVNTEGILDTKVVNNTTYNLIICEENGVRMKLWIPKYPESNATSSSNRIKTKSKTRKSLKSISQPHKHILTLDDKITQIYNQLSKATIEELLNMQKQVVRLNLNELPRSLKSEINTSIVKLMQHYQNSHKIVPQFVKKLRQSILREEMINKRRQQLEVLFCLEKEINLISKSPKKIDVVNYEDLEILPYNFSYMNSSIPGPDVCFTKNPPIGCDCIGKRICLLNNCCPEMFNSRATYNEAGQVMVPPNMPIYECNKNCKCAKLCSNRVVQRGGNVKLAIFRTKNNRWGVQASEFIKSGMFVIEYVGEVVKREHSIPAQLMEADDHYLFDLNFNTNKEDHFYTINSSKHGNISRFINHSSTPNLNVYSVWINSSDPNIYHVALFASRDIHLGEELTFQKRN